MFSKLYLCSGSSFNFSNYLRLYFRVIGLHIKRVFSSIFFALMVDFRHEEIGRIHISWAIYIERLMKIIDNSVCCTLINNFSLHKYQQIIKKFISFSIRLMDCHDDSFICLFSQSSQKRDNNIRSE